MSGEQAHFPLFHELRERRMIADGIDYDVAYPEALALESQERARQEKTSIKHEANLAPVRYGVRARGVRKPA